MVFCFTLILALHHSRAAQCAPNDTFAALETNYYYYMDMIATNDAIYIAGYYGEHWKLSHNFTLVWAAQYSEYYNWAMALSFDETFLIAGGQASTNVALSKINSSNGNIMSSVYTSQSDYYWHIYIYED